MQVFYRDFLGTEIRDRLTKGLLGRIFDCVINPANGEVVALYVNRDKNLLLPTVDITRYVKGVIWVETPEALATVDEIVRINEIIQLKTLILSTKVFTVSRAYLGEVIDYQLETNGWILTRLSVAKKILGVATDKKLINSAQIVRIAPTEITVRDAAVRVKGKVRRALTLTELSETSASFKLDE